MKRLPILADRKSFFLFNGYIVQVGCRQDADPLRLFVQFGFFTPALWGCHLAMRGIKGGVTPIGQYPSSLTSLFQGSLCFLRLFVFFSSLFNARCFLFLHSGQRVGASNPNASKRFCSATEKTKVPSH
ncbi:MAG: hypothetical protein MUP26_06355 [Desulfobulbaceae bacterium]|nr:hypothetical protein [Desulfobulbaceae bacterium]